VQFSISHLPPNSHPLVVNTFTFADREDEWTVNTGSDGSPSIFSAPPANVTSFHIDPTISHHIMFFHNGRKVWLFAPPIAENLALLRDMGLPDPLRLEDTIPKLKQLYIGVTSDDDGLSLPPFWLHGVVTGGDPTLHIACEVDHDVSLKDNTKLVVKEINRHARDKEILDFGFSAELITSLKRKSVREALGGKQEVAKIVKNINTVARKV